LAKLHSEVNQLIIHEFLVFSFASALIGATAAELRQGPPVTGVAIIMVLLELFFWYHTLMDPRSRITSFLRATRRSQREILYRAFADDMPFCSQRNVGVFLFAILGILVPILTFRNGAAAFASGASYVVIHSWLEIYIVVEFLYLGLVVNVGILKSSRNTLGRCCNHWHSIVRYPDLGVVPMQSDLTIQPRPGKSIEVRRWLRHFF
jgi:hypothetical protein